MSAPITDVDLEGSGGVVSGTLTISSGGNLTSASGSTVDISTGTVTLPSDVTRLGSTIELDGSEVANSLPGSKMDAMTGDSGAGGAKGAVPAPSAGDAAAGKFLKADATWAAPATVTDFLSLTDVDPSTYSGQTGKLVAVNSGEDGLEFVTAAAGVTDFTDLGDVPSSYSSQSLKLVRVNSGETALEFTDPTSGGSKTYEVWRATDGQPPASNYATLDTRNSIAVLDFDASTDESMVFVGILPEAADVSSGLIAIVKWMATSATSGSVIWEASIERCNTDLDSDSFDTVAYASGSANATSGIITSTSISMSNIDSLAEGELFRLKISRDADGTNGTDDMSGDAELIAVELRSGA